MKAKASRNENVHKAGMGIEEITIRDQMIEEADVHDHHPEAIEIPRIDLAPLGPPTATSIPQLAGNTWYDHVNQNNTGASSSTTPPASNSNDASGSSSTTQQPPEAQRPSALSLLAEDRGPSLVRQPVEPARWPSWEDASRQFTIVILRRGISEVMNTIYTSSLKKIPARTL